MALWARTAAPAQAADTDRPPSAQLVASQIRAASQAMQAAEADGTRLRSASAPAGDQVAQARLELELAAAGYRYRTAVRDEQAGIYRMAVDPRLQAAVVPLLPSPQASAVDSAASGLRALWVLAGIPPGTPVRVRHDHPTAAPNSLAELRDYYGLASRLYGVDWSYLAAINYIESDFGRNRNDSSAGAQGPMQFLPSTWGQYGAGGDIQSAHDSILAAGRYLVRNGAPGDMGTAVFRYNNDWDYVYAVLGFAAAMRAEPTWLERLFYWNTQG